jgi:ribosomal protein S18 acetylase RimI-like enzyme
MSPAAAVRRILYTDPIWAAYAIADLQPGFAADCTWRSASNGGDALTMLYRGLTPPVLFTMGAPGLVGRLLTEEAAAGALPATVYVSIPDAHNETVAAFYDFAADRRPMLRMALRRAVEIAAPAVPGLARLHADDVPRLQALYAMGGDFAPDAFFPYQVEQGVFYGIGGPEGELLAAGGTHVVDWGAGIGAIGNFYTRSDQRHKGYAGALLGAIVRDLRRGHVDTIVLNVDQRNVNAGRLYEHHGFAVHCPFIEGEAHRCR